MSYNLASPDSSAPTQDWRVWLEELRDLSPSAQVKAAIRQAEKMLKNQKSQGRRERPGFKQSRYEDID